MSSLRKSGRFIGGVGVSKPRDYGMLRLPLIDRFCIRMHNVKVKMALFKISRGILAPLCLRILKNVLRTTNKLIKSKIPDVVRPQHYKHPLILPQHKQTSSFGTLYQSKNRRYLSRATNFNNSISCFFLGNRESYCAHSTKCGNVGSITATIASQMKNTAPFAWTLRPNLTGGTLLRTSGGYSIGGGQASGIRFLSHVPTMPAQVLQNVSAATYAFWLSGKKAQFNGLTPLGEKSYRIFSHVVKETMSDIDSSSNSNFDSYIDFKINPTITALPPRLDSASPINYLEYSTHLNTAELLENLNNNFVQISKDLSIILSDLKKLSLLGNLSISLEGNSILRVHFPGYDRESLERLCNDFCIQRGTIHKSINSNSRIDHNTALRFPYASTSDHNSSQHTAHDLENLDDEFKEFLSFGEYGTITNAESGSILEKYQDSAEYDGIDGINRFLQQTSDMKRL